MRAAYTINLGILQNANRVVVLFVSSDLGYDSSNYKRFVSPRAGSSASTASGVSTCSASDPFAWQCPWVLDCKSMHERSQLSAYSCRSSLRLIADRAHREINVSARTPPLTRRCPSRCQASTRTMSWPCMCRSSSVAPGNRRQGACTPRRARRPHIV